MPSACPSEAVLARLVSEPEADPAAMAHVKACPACRAAMEELRGDDAFLANLAAAAGAGGGLGGAGGGGVPGTGRSESIIAGEPSLRRALPDVPGYQLVEEIHRGGQGVVYKAIHLATKRKVAIKLPLQGALSTERQRYRFEREIEIVAALRHPNIVTLFDSGVAADGRAFVAMEYIHGLPLDQHVKERLPPVTGARSEGTLARLRIMATIAAAVHHAHSRGVIHRDLKPANILIDSTGEPRVVDFGLARSLTLARGPMPTLTHEFAGTLGYASPEQVKGDPERIDARTDVYSLGMMLYEMLVGRPPYSVTGSISDVVQAISRTEPVPLSRSLPALGSELDALTLKSLAKDPERRYQSAGALRDDLIAYVEGRPIAARADSTWYVIRKAVRRHRGLLPALGLSAAAIVVGLSLAIFGLLQARSERDAARQAALDAKRATAVAERATQTEIDATEFLTDLFAAVDTRVAGPNVTVREVLDRATRDLDGGQFAQVPRTEARMRFKFGVAYAGLGLYDAAERQINAALEIRKRVLDPKDPDLAGTYAKLGAILQSKGDTRRANDLLAQAAAIYRQIWPEKDPESAANLHNAAVAARDAYDFEHAEPSFRRALEIRREVLGENDPLVAQTLSSMGVMYLMQGDLLAAEDALRKALDIRRRTLDPSHQDVAESVNNLGALLRAAGKFDQAEALAREAIAIARTTLGESHVDYAVTLSNLAQALAGQRKFEESVRAFDETLAAFDRAATGNPSIRDSVKRGMSVAAAADAALDAGQTARALELAREAQRIAKSIQGPAGWWPLLARGVEGAAHAAQQRFDIAEPLLLQAVEGMQARREVPAHALATMRARVASFYTAWGKPDRAAAFAPLTP
ncbi:MAG: serine/threonine protein kinase [Phycisphaerae bacterium]|nr:serine/threonine protein kinase [Phycisphaerae bacterium]